MRKSKMKQCRKKVEFSKLIYIFNLSFVVLVVITSFVCVIFSGRWGITDLSPITVICTSSISLFITSNIFYYRKAQAENVLKISRIIQKERLEIQTLETANQIIDSNFDNNI